MTGIPDAASFLDAVSGAAQPDLPPRVRLATVDPAYVLTGFPGEVALPRVTFDGETTLSTKQYPILGSYIPTASDRVVMVPVGRTYVVAGALGEVTLSVHGGTTIVTVYGHQFPLDSPPRVRARLSANVNAPHDAAFPGTPISWTGGSVVFDYQSQVTFNSATPTFFTVAVTGVYAVKGTATFTANNTGIRSAGLVVNGTEALTKIEPGPTALFPCMVQVEDEIACPAGTTIGLSYLQNSGTTLQLVGGPSTTTLKIRRVSQ